MFNVISDALRKFIQQTKFNEDILDIINTKLIQSLVC